MPLSMYATILQGCTEEQAKESVLKSTAAKFRTFTTFQDDVADILSLWFDQINAQLCSKSKRSIF